MNDLNYISGAVRQFSLWFANASIGNPILKGFEKSFYNAFENENSWVEQTYAIFMNNLKLDETGSVTNYKEAERRAAQYVRQYLDPSYKVEPVFEGWECELHSVSKDSYCN